MPTGSDADLRKLAEAAIGAPKWPSGWPKGAKGHVPLKMLGHQAPAILALLDERDRLRGALELIASPDDPASDAPMIVRRRNIASSALSGTLDGLTGEGTIEERLARALFAAGCCGTDPAADARDVLGYLANPQAADDAWNDPPPAEPDGEEPEHV